MAPIRLTMMMITTRSSLLCILDFVKEIVEDLSYNPDRSPGIIFVPTLYLLCSTQNTDNFTWRPHCLKVDKLCAILSWGSFVLTTKHYTSLVFLQKSPFMKNVYSCSTDMPLCYVDCCVVHLGLFCVLVCVLCCVVFSIFALCRFF